MSDDKGFRKMSDLVDALRNAELGMRSGTLGIEGLDRACDDARELYERLVVLRHKAREGKPKAPVQQPTAVAPPTPTPPIRAAAETTIRLDTRPPDPPRQTSLIEAIAASEEEPAPERKNASEYLKEPAPTTAPTEKKTASTLAEKLERAHINDLGKAISVSQRFWFTAQLFNDDRSAFDKAIVRLNSATDLEDATTWLNTEVLPHLKKPADPEAKTTFMELLQRRFA